MTIVGISALTLRLQMLALVFLLFISGVTLANPDPVETSEPSPIPPSLIFLPIADNTALTKPHEYIAESINAKYAEKYPLAKFTVIPFQKYLDQMSLTEGPETDSKILAAAAAVGAKYVVRTDLQKIEIKRGVEAFTFKKWCSADIPVKINIWDVAAGKTIFEGVIREKGRQKGAMFLLSSLLFFVSEKATINNGLEKIGKRMASELPLLQ